MAEDYANGKETIPPPSNTHFIHDPEWRSSWASVEGARAAWKGEPGAPILWKIVGWLFLISQISFWGVKGFFGWR